ncbi:MAG: YitT family protein [Roseburia sp.]
MSNSFFYKRSVWMDYICIVIGTGLIAMSVQCVYDPINLVTGGFSGLAIIIKAVTEQFFEGGIPLWLTNIVLNAPVFLIAYFVKGKKFIGRTLVGTILLSAWLYVIPSIDLTQSDYTLAAIFGGVIGGTGMGMVLMSRATTGGTDMVAALIQHKLRHYSVVQIMQILDGLIVLCGLYVFGMKAALYAIVAIFVTAKVSDMLMEGFKFSKVAYIITERYEEVAKAILTDLDRGVTALHAKGMYSGDEKYMLYCVVSKKEIVNVKDIVAKIDPDAFVIVSDATEVLGEGFLEYHVK